MPPQTRRPGAVLLVGAFVVVAVIGSALAGPFEVGQRGGGGGGAAPVIPPLPPQTSTPEPQAVDPGLAEIEPSIVVQRWIYLVVILVVCVLLAWLTWAIAKRVRAARLRREPQDVDDANPDVELGGDALDGATPALREGVRRAAIVLEDQVPPGDAVIAAWVALEASAGRTGLVRDRAQTATEFTVEVLGATRADPGATRTLLDLYLAARYSEHRLTSADVSRARESLAAIASDLTRREADA